MLLLVNPMWSPITKPMGRVQLMKWHKTGHYMFIVLFQRWVGHQGNCFLKLKSSFSLLKNAQKTTFMSFLTTSSLRLAASSSQYTLNLNIYSKNNNANKDTCCYGLIYRRFALLFAEECWHFMLFYSNIFYGIIAWGRMKLTVQIFDFVFLLYFIMHGLAFFPIMNS